MKGWRKMNKIQKLFDHAPNLPSIKVAIVYPTSKESFEGALLASAKKMIQPLFVGPAEKMKKIALELNYVLQDDEIIHTESDEEAVKISVKLVHDGVVQTLMKGDLHTDTLMSEVVHRERGLRAGRRMSHCMLLDVPHYHKLLIVTDAAMNILPDLKTKKDIVLNAIDFSKSIGVEKPKIACLSATEEVLDRMPSTVDCAALKKMGDDGEFDGAIIDGPMAFDMAISKEAALIKKTKSLVAGDPDVLLLPNIEAANILVKALDYLAGSVSCGVILGGTVPIILTSRSASAESRLQSCVLARFFSAYQQRKLP
jgi:phosphotransacetylase